jgi:kinesin family protein 13
MPEHRIIEINKSSNELFIIPLERTRNCVNKSVIREKTSLNNGDRILCGNNHFFRLNCPKSTSNMTNTSADQQKDRPMDYEFARQQFMMKEKINKALQEKHELDKNNASEEQKQNYEKQLKKLASFLSPGTPYPLYSLNNVFDPYGHYRFSGSSTHSTSPNSVASKMEK